MKRENRLLVAGHLVNLLLNESQRKEALNG